MFRQRHSMPRPEQTHLCGLAMRPAAATCSPHGASCLEGQTLRSLRVSTTHRFQECFRKIKA